MNDFKHTETCPICGKQFTVTVGSFEIEQLGWTVDYAAPMAKEQLEDHMKEHKKKGESYGN